jgi:hypothetical protein
MRLSEKTIELNFCAQFTRIAKPLILWFGLTQRQEAQAGFDACTRVNGRLLIFQFKTSNKILLSGRRRFYLQHDQLMNLQTRIKGFQRFVFYVFPLVGSTFEFSKNSNILGQSWFLDVACLPVMGVPTTRRGAPRKSRLHYADVAPGLVTIHSEPVELELLPATTYATQGFPGADGINAVFDSFIDFWEFCHYLLPTSAGAVITRTTDGFNAA